MSRITLRHPHHGDAVDVKQKIKLLIDQTARKYGIRHRWSGNVCNLSGPVKGQIEIKNDHLDVKLKLGFAASLFKSKIENEIRQELDRHIPMEPTT